MPSAAAAEGALMLARVGAACLAAALLAGCGTGGIAEGSADAGRGEQLFTANCGSCHTLRAAGTAGKIGPNLDDAFRSARQDGLGESTIREVVLGQIRFPAPPTASPETPAMPEDIVEGDDAEAVAAYVASVAANPEAQVAAGGAAGGSDPKSLLATNCGSCHTLSAAGINGTVGPSLDQTQKDRAAIERQIANGSGAMPPFKDVLSEQQIRAIADYILKNKKG
jgi:cbb3-type cytochrome c oxidase subunit III